MALIGYARVSKEEQNLGLQLDALKEKGCVKIFTDKLTGVKFDERKQLQACFEFLREGDTFVVWKLDRLGRSLKHLIETIHDLQGRSIGFISLTENIDTTTPGGMLIFHIMGALAQFERDLIRQRTNAGLSAARARGRSGGRPNKVKAEQIAMMKKMYADQTNSVDSICSTFHITRATLYRYVSKDRKKES